MSSAPQGSDEWRRERAGHVTASRFADVLAKIKTGEAASRRNYRTQLVTERLTGEPVESFKNAAMQWGIDHEAEARSALETAHGYTIITTGFVPHPSIQWVGCSPDGLIDADGLTQIKCPHVSTIHVETVMENRMPSGHYAQVQGEMWVTGRLWSLYASYDPRMPKHLRLYSTLVRRDDTFIAGLEKEVLGFLAEVNRLYEDMMKK